MACISELKSPVVPHLFNWAAMTVNHALLRMIRLRWTATPPLPRAGRSTCPFGTGSHSSPHRAGCTGGRVARGRLRGTALNFIERGQIDEGRGQTDSGGGSSSVRDAPPTPTHRGGASDTDSNEVVMTESYRTHGHGCHSLLFLNRSRDATYFLNIFSGPHNRSSTHRRLASAASMMTSFMLMPVRMRVASNRHGKR